MTEAVSDPKGKGLKKSYFYISVKIKPLLSGLARVEANDDGTLVAISGKSGAFSVYLTKLPRIGAASKGRVVVLSALSEIKIIYETETVRRICEFQRDRSFRDHPLF